MGAQSSSYKILYGEKLGQWDDLPGLFSLWTDIDDINIETTRTLGADRDASSLFKLQRYVSVGTYRIVLRDYSLKRQMTVVENCSSRPDARLACQTLLSVLLDEDMQRPATVEQALRRHHRPIGGRFQHVGNPADNRFPEAMLQPINESWNPADFEADIILVHGLDGHALDTWTNGAGLWPIIWLLNTQHGIESMRNQFEIRHLPQRNKIRVLTVSHRGGRSAADNESDPVIIAKNLVRLLFHAGVGSKPIIWLAHSLGGLIVKEVLHFASKHRIRRDIFTSTKGVVFFGTPHNGASWATTQRQLASMQYSKSLFYLDPTPSSGDRAGNLTQLNELNQFFLRSSIPFLNFSEGTITPQLLFAGLLKIVIVSDAQAYMNAPNIVTGADLAGQLALNIVPARVHYHYPQCHHLNIAKPTNLEDPTYRYTKLYVAHWIQRRPIADNLREITDWDQYTRRIVNTVRLYAVVIESIANNHSNQRLISGIGREQMRTTLIPLSGGISTVLDSMTINQLLILIALFSSLFVGTSMTGFAVGAAIAGSMGALVGGVSVITAFSFASRLSGYVRTLLKNNITTLRELVNVVNRYVMPDFEAAVATATSQQDLEATLNDLCRNITQTICSVFLQPTLPHTTLEDPALIRQAALQHHHLLFQAEMVATQLATRMDERTEILNDEGERRVRAILNDDFIRDALRTDVINTLQ